MVSDTVGTRENIWSAVQLALLLCGVEEVGSTLLVAMAECAFKLTYLRFNSLFEHMQDGCQDLVHAIGPSQRWHIGCGGLHIGVSGGITSAEMLPRAPSGALRMDLLLWLWESLQRRLRQ